MLILTVPDLHMPFHHKDALDLIRDSVKEYKPDLIVNLGDEVDFHALGRWDHDPDGMSAGDELQAAKKALKLLYKITPRVSVCESNHTDRPFRKAFSHGIPRAFMRAYAEFLEAPKGWRWAPRWVFDGVQYIHGEGFSGKDAHIKAALTHRQSTVIGHVHSFAGVQYSATSQDLLFGMNSGCLIDRDAYSFRYGASLVNKPILGIGLVEDGRHAHFVPMDLGGR